MDFWQNYGKKLAKAKKSIKRNPLKTFEVTLKKFMQLLKIISLEGKRYSVFESDRTHVATFERQDVPDWQRKRESTLSG